MTPRRIGALAKRKDGPGIGSLIRLSEPLEPGLSMLKSWPVRRNADNIRQPVTENAAGRLRRDRSNDLVRETCVKRDRESVAANQILIWRLQPVHIRRKQTVGCDHVSCAEPAR